MKSKSSQIVLICSSVCLLLFNIALLFLRHQDQDRLDRAVQSMNKLERLKNIELLFEISKEITIKRLRFEQHNLCNTSIYIGSDNHTILPLKSITTKPKIVIGLNQNMCSPCIEGVLRDLKEFFPDYETNPNIILIAEIEQRFKNNYYNMKVVSFHQKNDFPLYEIELPYFFILDEDLCVKMLFITDKTSPELTKAYLKIIRERYPDI